LNGDLGTCAAVSQQLPKALSFQGAFNIGRYVYAVGGFDGAAAVKDVYRAELLDPLNAPQISDVDVRLNANQGLAPGLYTYRLSAVFKATDARNPGGESLASDFFPLQLQMVSNGMLQVVLSWTPVAGAQSYKIYRSPAANAAAGSEKLLATVNDTGTSTTQTYTDTGA